MARVLVVLGYAVTGLMTLAILVAILVVTLVVALTCWVAVSAPSTEKMEHKIERDIPVGASVADIKHWLATEGRKEGVEDPGSPVYTVSDDSELLAEGISRDTPVYKALLPGNPGLEIWFILDKDLRFQRAIVKQYVIAP